jgi:hypothetical protein
MIINQYSVTAILIVKIYKSKNKMVSVWYENLGQLYKVIGYVLKVPDEFYFLQSQRRILGILPTYVPMCISPHRVQLLLSVCYPS